MKPAAHHLKTPLIRTGVATLFAVALASGAAFSQGVDSFGKDAPSDKDVTDTKSEAEPPAPATAPLPVDSTQSRFAGNDMDSYIRARAAVLSMRDRETDPFGLNQDPNAKPVERKVIASRPARTQAALPPTPLAEIVKLIRVTTIMPSEKSFLVGVRRFEESDEFPLQYRGKTFKMKIVEVSSRRIVFRDLDKDEEAVLEAEMLPAGMVAGGGQLRPPGMVSPDDDRPLELESEMPPEALNN